MSIEENLIMANSTKLEEFSNFQILSEIRKLGKLGTYLQNCNPCNISTRSKTCFQIKGPKKLLPNVLPIKRVLL